MNNLSDFIVNTSQEQTIFKEQRFLDSSEIHDYITNGKDSIHIEKFDSINSIFYFYSELRAYAEMCIDEGKTLPCLNKKNELPVYVEDFYDFVSGETDLQKDAPPDLIVKIASEKYDSISFVKDNMIKILKRERRLTRIDQAKQFDTQCIHWYVKQPGITLAQKAGVSQKLKAVVRYESYDTLENRVFKDFCRLCLVNCKSYLKEYAGKYFNSKRIKDVIKLQKLVKSILDMEVMKSVSNLHMMPQPNYVLQNNPRYHLIWDLYQELLHKERIIDTLWRNRHIVYKNLVDAIFYCICYHNNIGRCEMMQFLWIYQFPTIKGHYFSGFINTFAYNVRTEKSLVSIDFGILRSFIIKKDVEKTIRLFVAFIPTYSADILRERTSEAIIVINESTRIDKVSNYMLNISNSISNRDYSCNIITKLFSILSKVYDERKSL